MAFPQVISPRIGNIPRGAFDVNYRTRISERRRENPDPTRRDSNHNRNEPERAAFKLSIDPLSTVNAQKATDSPRPLQPPGTHPRGTSCTPQGRWRAPWTPGNDDGTRTEVRAPSSFVWFMSLGQGRLVLLLGHSVLQVHHGGRPDRQDDTEEDHPVVE